MDISESQNDNSQLQNNAKKRYKERKPLYYYYNMDENTHKHTYKNKN